MRVVGEWRVLASHHGGQTKSESLWVSLERVRGLLGFRSDSCRGSQRSEWSGECLARSDNPGEALRVVRKLLEGCQVSDLGRWKSVEACQRGLVGGWRGSLGGQGGAVGDWRE